MGRKKQWFKESQKQRTENRSEGSAPFEVVQLVCS
jgi:hypothetical protein